METPISPATDAEVLPWDEPSWDETSDYEREWIERIKSLSEEEFGKLVDFTSRWLDNFPDVDEMKAVFYDRARRDHLALYARLGEFDEDFDDFLFNTIEKLEDFIYVGWIKRNRDKCADRSPSSTATPIPSSKPLTGVVITIGNVALPQARRVQVQLMPQPIHYETLPVAKLNSSATQVLTKVYASSPQTTTDNAEMDPNKPSAMEAQPSAPGHEPTTDRQRLTQVRTQASPPESEPDISGHYRVRNYGPPPSARSPFASASRMVLPASAPAESSFEPSPITMSDEFCKLLRKLEHHKSVVEQLLGEYEPRCAESSAEFASICKQKIDTLEETIMMLPDTASQEIVKKWRKRTVHLWKWYFSVVSAKKRAKN